jgi:hypothetical protein
MNLPNALYQIDDIKTAYGNITSYGSAGIFTKQYLLLESVLTDANATLIRFDDTGLPIFTEKQNQSYNDMKQIHDGVLRYFTERLPLARYDDNDEIPAFDAAEALFGQLFTKSIVMPIELKKTFINDDRYDGRRSYQSFTE